MNDVKEFVTEEERFFSKSHEGKELRLDMVFYPKGYKERVQGKQSEECATMKLHHLCKEQYCECTCHKRSITTDDKLNDEPDNQ